MNMNLPLIIIIGILCVIFSLIIGIFIGSFIVSKNLTNKSLGKIVIDTQEDSPLLYLELFGDVSELIDLQFGLFLINTIKGD